MIFNKKLYIILMIYSFIWIRWILNKLFVFIFYYTNIKNMLYCNTIFSIFFIYISLKLCFSKKYIKEFFESSRIELNKFLWPTIENVLWLILRILCLIIIIIFILGM